MDGVDVAARHAGGAGLWDYLEPLAALVTDVATTHRYDQRGCGRSSPSVDFGTARSVADLDELRRHRGHRSWTVVGHSFGARLAIAYAAAHPDAVDAVVHVSGVGLDWPAHRLAHRAAKAAWLSDSRRNRLDELGRRDRDPAEEIEWRTLTWLPDFVEPGAEVAARRPADGPRRLAAALPDAEFVLVAGAGHLPWRERPDELRTLLRRVLAL